ncbi:TolC family protein [bacterium]|nr:TolC family protein [bacterium]MBU1994078.1 TolC family protein [bacterium]
MKVSNLLIALSLLCSSLAVAKDTDESLEDYISKNKQTQFSYDYQKNEAESSKLRDSWIAPLNLNYSYSKSNPYGSDQTSENAALKMDQPIFQSGGIYYGIKFAEASKLYSNYSVDVAKRKLIKDAISLLMQIKQMDMKIEKQNLQIKNSEINLELKKEQYLNGQLDSGFLDNAIIERNFVIQALYDIETNKERLVSKFNAISDISYKEAPIPHLTLLDKESFLSHNIVLAMADSQIEKSRYAKNVTTAKYLPRISATAGYNWSKSDSPFQFGSTEKDYYDYGIKASMPFDVNTFVDVESSRVDYLKSKLVIEDKKRELIALFEQVMQNIENFEKKKVLSAQNKDIYVKLLKDTKKLYKAGYKTQYDVEILSNSVQIQELDSKAFEIDRQLELLTLYEMYVNEI